MQILGFDVDNTDIVVRAYANTKGLGRALRRDSKMRERSDLASFARGFTQRQGLFDFVDVGSGKEEADEKIRGKSSLQKNQQQTLPPPQDGVERIRYTAAERGAQQ